MVAIWNKGVSLWHLPVSMVLRAQEIFLCLEAVLLCMFFRYHPREMESSVPQINKKEVSLYCYHSRRGNPKDVQCIWGCQWGPFVVCCFAMGSHATCADFQLIIYHRETPIFLPLSLGTLFWSSSSLCIKALGDFICALSVWGLSISFLLQLQRSVEWWTFRYRTQGPKCKLHLPAGAQDTCHHFSTSAVRTVWFCPMRRNFY